MEIIFYILLNLLNPSDMNKPIETEPTTTTETVPTEPEADGIPPIEKPKDIKP